MVKYLSIQRKKRLSPKAIRRAIRERKRRRQRRDVFVAPEIPFDLMIEILRRLPAKSLMRFKCVSKLWSGLIRSRFFCNFYLSKVLSSPRYSEPLLLYIDFCFESELLSLTLSSPSNSAESPWLEPDFTFPGMGGTGVHRIVILRGLILYTFCREAFIYNPATRQRLNLPAVTFAQQELNKHVYYFFGHDPVLDQYKIVCNVFERWITSEFWVFILEPGGFWKKIEYNDQPHVPTGQGLCINGVIYYLASTATCRHNVYSFDVRSEEFRVIQAPHAVSQFCKLWNFIEHGGKPALFDYTLIRETGVSELWVLEDGLGGTWSRKSLVLKPCQRPLVDDIVMGCTVHSTAHNNEIILALPCPRYLLYYDLIKNDLRKVNIIGGTTRDMWIHVMYNCENIMHLET